MWVNKNRPLKNLKRKAASIAGLALVLLFAFIYYHTGRILRPLALNRISELTGAEVSIASVDFKLNGLVRIHKISLRPPGPKQYDDTIIKADTLDIRFAWMDILTLEPAIRKLTLNNFTLNVQYDLDMQKWNVAALALQKSYDRRRQLPLVTAKNGRIKYTRVTAGIPKEIAALPVEGGFGAIEDIRDCYTFYLQANDAKKFGQSWVSGSWQAGQTGKILLKGRIASAKTHFLQNTLNISDLDIELNYDGNCITLTRFKLSLPNKALVDMTGIVKNYASLPEFEVSLKATDLLISKKPIPNALVYTDEFLKNFNPFVQKFFRDYSPEGSVDIQTTARGAFDNLSKTTCIGNIVCKNIGIRYNHFPYGLRHLKGTINLTEKSFLLNNLTAAHNDVKVTISGSSEGSGPDWDCFVKITSPNMILDNDLYSALSKEYKKLWFAFAPTGSAQVEYIFRRKPDTEKSHTLLLRALGASAVCQYFPYPLKNITGDIRVHNGTAELVNLTSAYDNHKLTLNGTISDAGSDLPDVNIVIKAENIPLNSDLKAAMPDNNVNFFEHFDVNAAADAEMKLFSDRRNPGNLDYFAVIDANAAYLVYDRFPVKITNASISATLSSGQLNIKSLTGRTETGTISATGTIRRADVAHSHPDYSLVVKADRLRLTPELINVLPAAPAKILANLRPEGLINFSAVLSADANSAVHKHYVDIECLDVTADFKKFQYPFKNVTGRISVKNDSIELKNISALCDNSLNLTESDSKIGLNGKIYLNTVGFDSADISLSAENILFDDKLCLLLPPSLRHLYTGIAPTGRFGLDIEKIKISPDDHNNPLVEFEGDINLNNCSFGQSRWVDNLNASLRTDCLYSDTKGFIRAEAACSEASCSIARKEVKNIITPIRYNPQTDMWLMPDFTADCYGGKLTGDISLKKEPQNSLDCSMRLSFNNVNLREFLAAGDPNNGKTDHTSGLMGGELALISRGDSNSATGRLNLQISDMRVGKMAPLAKVLAVLKLTEPADYAFSNMNLDAYLKTNSVFFDQVYMQGDSFALSGSGTMNLKDKTLDLNLAAAGSRLASEPSLLGSLAAVLEPAIVKVVVTGKFDDPNVATVPLPFIKTSLGLLGTERIKPKK